jgi:hypothetical protein
MSSTIMAVDSSPFPAIVEPEVFAKNAKFAQLVELLAKNCLAPDGSSQELKKKFDQVRGESDFFSLLNMRMLRFFVDFCFWRQRQTLAWKKRKDVECSLGRYMTN